MAAMAMALPIIVLPGSFGPLADPDTVAAVVVVLVAAAVGWFLWRRK
jgi:hypothetical protein